MLFGGIFGLEFEKAHLKSTPSNLSGCKVWCKKKILKFGTKNALFGYFWAGIWKYYCHVSNQCPRICLVAKSGAKIRILKFRTENALFGYFWTGIWKNCSHISNQHPEICLIANFTGTKNVWFGYFWTGIWNKYCHLWNQHPRICLIAKYREIMKMP